MRSPHLLLLTAAICACVTPTPSANVPGAGHAPGPAEVIVAPGTGVMLSGTFEYSGTVTGLYRIDVMRAPAGAAPTLVRALTLPSTGAWQVELPKGLGPVSVMGFLDVGGQGPGPSAPSMTVYGLEVGDAPIEGIQLAPVEGGKVVGQAPVLAPPPDGTGPAPGAVPPSGAPDATGTLAPIVEQAAAASDAQAPQPAPR